MSIVSYCVLLCHIVSYCVILCLLWVWLVKGVTDCVGPFLIRPDPYPVVCALNRPCRRSRRKRSPKYRRWQGSNSGSEMIECQQDNEDIVGKALYETMGVQNPRVATWNDPVRLLEILFLVLEGYLLFRSWGLWLTPLNIQSQSNIHVWIRFQTECKPFVFSRLGCCLGMGSSQWSILDRLSGCPWEVPTRLWAIGKLNIHMIWNWGNTQVYQESPA